MKHYLCLLGILLCSSATGATEVPSGPAVGTVAPDFKVHNLVTGEDVTLTSQHGKVVMRLREGEKRQRCGQQGTRLHETTSRTGPIIAC